MNRTRIAIVLALVLSSAGAASAAESQATKESQGNPWTNLNYNNGSDVIRFVIMADRCGGDRPGIWQKGIDRVNLLQPEFVMNVGDTIPGYTDVPAVIEKERAEFDAMVKSLKMPFFYVPGNHDLTSPELLQSWIKRYGRPYYHFLYKNALFLVLNTEEKLDGSRSAYIGDEQAAYFKKVLAENKDVRWTFVFLHKPIWVYKNDTGRWNEVEALLAERPHTVFVGHTHGYAYYQRHGQDYIVLATTGGSSDLRGVPYGEFDHVTLVTLTKDGPSIANLMLDGIAPKDIRTAATAEYVADLNKNFSVDMSPVGRLQGNSFTAAATQVKITNGTDHAMQFKGAFRNGAILTIPRELQAEVPARGEQSLDVKFASLSPVPAEQLEPVVLDWNVLPSAKTAGAVRIDGVASAGVDLAFTCERAAKPVVIDGKLDEWGDLPIAMVKPMQSKGMAETWNGPLDASMKFKAAYDDQYVYLAVQVTDDVVLADAHKSPWDQDGLEIRLDARVGPQSNFSESNIFGVFLCPGDTPEQTIFVDAKDKPKGTQAVCVKTPTGYAAEVAIPVSYLNERQGGAWKQFRLNIALDDSDAPGEGVQLWWRPDWRSGENFADSGVFERK